MKIFNVILILIIYILVLKTSDAQVNYRNYFLTKDVVYPNIKNENDLTYSNTLETVSYLDDFGSIDQIVKKKYSSSGRDLIFAKILNAAGLDEHNFQPYTDELSDGSYRLNVSDGNSKFYLKEFYDKFGLAPAQYEKSALCRIKKLGYPGADWQLDSHFKEFEYLHNTNIENLLNVKLWTIDEDNCGTSGNYKPYDLFVTKITDHSDFSQFFSFTDKTNKLILIREVTIDGLIKDTYFIYDCFEKLRYVITPEGINKNVSSFTFDDTFTKNYVYSYIYDSRGRMIQRQLPGKSVEYYVYNNSDNIILYRDSNMEYSYYTEWKFFKYDAMGRIIMKGQITYYPDHPFEILQKLANQCAYTFESLTSINAYPMPNNNYYSDNAFPIISSSNSIIEDIFYYDTYYISFNKQLLPIAIDPSLKFDLTGSQLSLNLPTPHVTGLLTVSYSRIDTRLYAETKYYDEQNRIIQAKSQNHVGGVETWNYLFERLDNKFSKCEHIHKSLLNGVLFEQNEIYTYNYDVSGRLNDRTYKCGSSDPQKIVYTYSDLDYPLKAEVLENNKLIQTMEYHHNIRGWLTKINEPSDVNVNGTLFGLELYYNTKNPFCENTLYNGNISSERWATVKPSEINDSYIEGEKAYKYKYDSFGRLESSEFYDKSSSGWINSKFFNFNTSYDLNGNILCLKRNGKFSNSALLIDDLTYTYNGNQVIAVDDKISSQLSSNDFNDDGHYFIPGGKNEYSYDKNGNLVSDVNKGISNISYDYNYRVRSINLTNSCRIQYVYDSRMNKKKEYIYVNGILRTTYDYVDNFVYENGVPKYNLFDDGRVVYETPLKYHNQYFIKDQLGSIRVIYEFDKVNLKNKVVEVDSYFPFGMSIKDLCRTNLNNSNKNGYISKKFTDEFNLDYYDFNFRNYDPILCRWNSIDPSCEKYYNQSPYQYCSNNPIKYLDPNGKYIHPDSEAIFDEFLQTVFDEQANVLDKIKKLKSNDFKSKKAKQLIYKFAGLQRVQKAMEKMNKSKFQYRLNKLSGYEGEIKYSYVTNIIDIDYTDFASFSHESIHAYQFEVGELSFVNSDNPMAIVDAGDELEAYYIQWMVRPESVENLNSAYNGYLITPSTFTPAWLRGHDSNKYKRLVDIDIDSNCQIDDIRPIFKISLTTPNSLIKDCQILTSQPVEVE